MDDNILVRYHINSEGEGNTSRQAKNTKDEVLRQNYKAVPWQRCAESWSLVSYHHVTGQPKEIYNMPHKIMMMRSQGCALMIYITETNKIFTSEVFSVLE